MISEKMSQTMNEQINREMYSAYLYMAMSTHCSTVGLKGFAKWFMIQYHEEMFHAMKIYTYLLRQGVHVQLQPIQGPPIEFASPLDMFEKTLEHEQYITRCINDLMEQAISEKDHATQIFLQWYVTEQVEEEENDNDIIAQLKLVGDSPQGLLMIDRDLGGRTTTVPTDFSTGVEGSEAD